MLMCPGRFEWDGIDPIESHYFDLSRFQGCNNLNPLGDGERYSP